MVNLGNISPRLEEKFFSPLRSLGPQGPKGEISKGEKSLGSV